MPGPMGEKCENCYWWDIDNRTGKKGDEYAECCIDSPNSRIEIIDTRCDKFCSNFLNREYGIETKRKEFEDEIDENDNE